MSHYHALPHAVALNARISFFSAAQSQGSLLSRLHTALTVAQTRRALAKMDARALADVGLTQEQASVEASRSFWDVTAQCK